ncbi:MAG: chemotaxis protein CheA [Methylococcaceae bacterium]|nr:MAG: chemotaxis protein CheA [Methylococcaceae bacterium]
MNLDQALATYIAESRDLLGEMEDRLLHLEQDPLDGDAINALFRAVHTIKGSAGLFGLDYVVVFTHVVEHALDKVREGELTFDAELIAVMLSCRDHIDALIEHVSACGTVVPEGELPARGEALLDQLRQRLLTQASAGLPVDAESHRTAEVESCGREVSGDNWHISVRFGQDSLRNGMDPISFIRYLGTLGEVVSIVTLFENLPSFKDIDPEACYLGFEMSFKSAADKETIAGTFDFVRQDSLVRILPPHSKLSDYLSLIQMQDPASDPKLGDILVNCGTLTRQELHDALAFQQRTAADTEDHVAPPLGEILVGHRLVAEEAVNAALQKQQQIRENKARENLYIRVLADKLDHLINLVGELVIAGASANLLARRQGDKGLQEATSRVTHLVEDIRDQALQLRMVEIGDTFNRFRRVVRDVSLELGKEIELQIDGAETELDKTVVEQIGDPLLHLVRNAIDHGIEPATVRIAAGKPAKGTVSLNAYHDSGSIIIEVADDGGGLNRDKILKRAIERGIVTPEQNLDDRDIYNLIFEPGFSTVDQVTNLSGRGVGMDVVKRNITALSGSVELDSQLGAGSVVSIRLPLTLAIIDGFLVGVGGSFYVVPLDMVVECLELSAEERKSALERNYINLRGEVLPFLRLRDLFRENGKAGRRENIVVVQFSGRKAGFMVDELLGEFQTVIKPLGKLFVNLQGISGSTILGGGEVALILDVPALLQMAANKEMQVTAPFARAVATL